MAESWEHAPPPFHTFKFFDERRQRLPCRHPSRCYMTWAGFGGVGPPLYFMHFSEILGGWPPPAFMHYEKCTMQPTPLLTKHLWWGILSCYSPSGSSAAPRNTLRAGTATAASSTSSRALSSIAATAAALISAENVPANSGSNVPTGLCLLVLWLGYPEVCNLHLKLNLWTWVRHFQDLKDHVQLVQPIQPTNRRWWSQARPCLTSFNRRIRLWRALLHVQFEVSVSEILGRKLVRNEGVVQISIVSYCGQVSCHSPYSVSTASFFAWNFNLK